LSLDDARLPRVNQVIAPCSELSWARAPAPPLVPLTEDQVTARAARAAATLARQLITRHGNLHLPAVAPVIAALPDPDAAWIAILTLLAELTAAGAVPPVTSVTQFRWADDGTPEHVALPPEAETLLDRTPAATGWLGADLAAPGQPAWLLDEAITPARLRWPPPAPRLSAALRAATRLITDADGTITGLSVHANRHAVSGHSLRATPAPPGLANRAAPRHAAPAGPPEQLPVLPGYLAVHIEGRLGQAWVGRDPITPENFALLVCELGLAGHPILLINQASTASGCPALHPWATRLAALLHQLVLIADAPLT
jgi:hypothetical protein